MASRQPSPTLSAYMNTPLSISESQETTRSAMAYAAVEPNILLSKIYDKYRQRGLELNVQHSLESLKPFRFRMSKQIPEKKLSFMPTAYCLLCFSVNVF